MIDWLSFAAGIAACVAVQLVWAAVHAGGWALRVLGQWKRAQLLEDLFVGLFIVGVLVVFTIAVYEALVVTAMSIRTGVW